MTACTIDGCSRPLHGRELCSTHYERRRLTGTTDLIRRATKVCTVDGCDSRALAKGLCSRHYWRQRKHGTTTLTSFEESFWARVDKTDTCWLWTDAPALTGYGRVSRDNVVDYAHRVAYELAVGPIPPGLTIDHLCRVRLCVNPTHLEPVTLAENTRREMLARKELTS